MSDIVERLRKCKTGWGKIKDEAADLIESLRAELAAAKSSDTHVKYRYWESIAAKRLEEVEQLRAILVEQRAEEMK